MRGYCHNKIASIPESFTLIGSRPGWDIGQQHGHHLPQIQGFGQKVAHSGGLSGGPFLGHDPGRQGDDGELRESGVFSQRPGRRQPIHYWHLDIHQHHVESGGAGAQGVQGLLAIRRQADRRPFQVQGALQHEEVDAIVIDGQDPEPGQPGTLHGDGGRGLQSGRGLGRARQGQLEPEGAALSRRAGDADGAAHQFD